MTPTVGTGAARDAILLAARFLLMLLFVIFGWEKLTGFGGTIGYFAQIGVPLPALAALIAVAMEFFAGIAVMFGFLTRPLAILLALYTLGTGILGHHFWTMTGMARLEAEINFFKNISIIGGFLVLYVTGAGKYSVDARIGLAE